MESLSPLWTLAAVAVAGVLALGACGREDDGLFAGTSPAAAPSARAGAAAYLGRWARSAGECATRPFVFATSEIRAPAGAWCEVGATDASPAGYSLSTVCHSPGGKATPGRLLVTIPDGAAGRAMTVEGGPLDRPLGLVRCGGAAEVAAAPASAG